MPLAGVAHVAALLPATAWPIADDGEDWGPLPSSR